MSTAPIITRLDDYPLKRLSLLWLIAAQGLAVAPFLLQLPVWVALISLSLLGLRAVSIVKLIRPPARALLIVMVVVAIVAVIAQFGTLVGRDAGTALLLLLLGLKQFETKALRDAIIGVFLGYLALAALFLFTQSIPTALYALVTGVLLVSALVTLNPGSGEVGVRDNFRLALRLILQSAPIVAVLFLFFPRIEGPLWKTPTNETSGRTGLGEEMSPGQISRLIRSTQPAFRVTFDAAVPSEPERYWRGPVLWDFDGRTWRMAETLTTRNPQAEVLNQRRPIDYRLTLEPHGRRWVFALDLPALAPANIRLTSDFQLRAQEPIREVRQFRLRSYLEHGSDHELDPLQRRLGLALPARYAQRARDLGESWRAELGSELAVVRRALDYFNERPFVYTLNPPTLPDDPVDEFLFETRRGFCEHYASSFVVLMRAAGIPARVVTGYQGGEYNTLGNYLLVRQADAHAWAEVWLSGRGWMRVDPTAAVNPERIELGIEAALSELDQLPIGLRSGLAAEWLRGVRLAWDSVNYHWNEWVLAYGPEKQQQLLARLGWRGSDGLALVAALIFALLVVVVSSIAVSLWPRRMTRGEPALRLYQRFCQRLERIGLARHPGEGPQDFARRVTRDRPDLAREVNPIIQLYTGIRYAGAVPDGVPRLHALVSRFKPRPPTKKKPAEAG